MKKKELKDLLAFDKKHIWHPYTSLTKPLPVYPVQSAEGVYLKLENGKQIIDAMSSWWSTIHGYNHPTLNAAAEKQIRKMSHVMFGGITHKPAIKLCQQLVQMTPKKLTTVFLADSGSVSVEAAIKMALQYWIAKGKTKKKKLMTIRKGYHGDTLGAMSVCDPKNGMHSIFSGYVPQQIFIKEPQTKFNQKLLKEDILNLKKAFKKHHKKTAAFILEPIVQGAGGMRIYSPQYLAKVAALCKQYKILLIADEIATGFGRTGKLFACNHAEVEADILCVGKALTGGMMTMAACLCSTKVAKTISNGKPGVFMHGPTFMANPLAASVALASLQILNSNTWKEQVSRIEKTLLERLQPLIEHPKVADIRVLGAIGVVECKQQIDVAKIQAYFVKQGVWIRPFNKLIYIMPPYIMKLGELLKVCNVIQKSLNKKEHFISD